MNDVIQTLIRSASGKYTRTLIESQTFAMRCGLPFQGEIDHAAAPSPTNSYINAQLYLVLSSVRDSLATTISAYITSCLKAFCTARLCKCFQICPVDRAAEIEFRLNRKQAADCRWVASRVTVKARVCPVQTFLQQLHVS